jgi:hypothetical protein
VYFTTLGSNGWSALTVSDGTAANTKSWYSVNTNSGVAFSELTNVGGVLYYAMGNQLWYGDCSGGPCTTSTWSRLVDPAYNGPANLTNVDGTLFYTATSDSGRELWAYTP